MYEFKEFLKAIAEKFISKELLRSNTNPVFNTSYYISPDSVDMQSFQNLVHKVYQLITKAKTTIMFKPKRNSVERLLL